MLTFTAKQRLQLQRAGLLKEQIEHLEEKLGLCKVFLAKPAPLNEIKGKLQTLRKRLGAAEKELTKFISSKSPGAGEARIRIQDATLDVDQMDESPTDRLAQTVAMLTSTLSVVDRAVADLPTAERRHRISSPFPIQQIANALLYGFIEHHAAASGRRDRHRIREPYKIKVSLTKEPFPTVATIFYEALGYEAKDLTRPINNYLKLIRRRRLAPDTAKAGPLPTAGGEEIAPAVIEKGIRK